MNKIEFIAKARFLAWICYQMGANQKYNIAPTKDQLDSLKQGVIYGLKFPNNTPQQNHENWMKCKISQGWTYGTVKNISKKTHPDLVPFDKLPKVEKDKDIMDCLMNQKFNELWEQLNKNEATPLIFTPACQNYYSAGDDSEILCPNCECSLDEYDIEDKQFRYCPECGQKLMTIDEMRSNNR